MNAELALTKREPAQYFRLQLQMHVTCYKLANKQDETVWPSRELILLNLQVSF